MVNELRGIIVGEGIWIIVRPKRKEDSALISLAQATYWKNWGLIYELRVKYYSLYD